MGKAVQEAIAIIANIIVVAGAIYALCEWLRFKCRREREKKSLVRYLEARAKEAISEGKKGEHSLTHLVAKLKIPADRILNLAFDDDNIEVKVKKDETGLADKLLLTYRK